MPRWTDDSTDEKNNQRWIRKCKKDFGLQKREGDGKNGKLMTNEAASAKIKNDGNKIVSHSTKRKPWGKYKGSKIM